MLVGVGQNDGGGHIAKESVLKSNQRIVENHA
jgi:hypothetical protein